VQTTLQGGKLNLIGALSVSPRYQRLSVHAHLHTSKMDGLAVIAFLKNLLGDIRGRIVLLWDNSPIHTDQQVQRFLKHHPRVQYYSFPTYAPELNPAEGLWHQINLPLGNRVCHDVPELTRLVAKTFCHLRKKQDILWSCIHASELPWKQ
jgi:putative transposase